MRVLLHGTACLAMLTIVSLAAPCFADDDSPSDRDTKPAAEKKDHKDGEHKEHDGHEHSDHEHGDHKEHGDQKGHDHGKAHGSQGEHTHAKQDGKREARHAKRGEGRRGRGQRGGARAGRRRMHQGRPGPGMHQRGGMHRGGPRAGMHPGRQSFGGRHGLQQQIDALDHKLNMIIRLLHESRNEGHRAGPPGFGPGAGGPGAGGPGGDHGRWTSWPPRGNKLGRPRVGPPSGDRDHDRGEGADRADHKEKSAKENKGDQAEE